MRERLDMKILNLVLVLLIVGILAAGMMVLTIEKNSLYSIAESSLESTADVIEKDIQRTMLEGKAHVTRSMIQELKGLKAIEDVTVIHYDGHYAFSNDTSIAEGSVMKQLMETKEPFHVHDSKKMIFYKPLMNEERCKLSGAHIRSCSRAGSADNGRVSHPLRYRPEASICRSSFPRVDLK